MLLKSLGGSMGSYSGLQCHMKGSIWTCFFKWRSLWNLSSVASINKILISNYLFLKMNGFKKFRRF